MSGWGRWIPLSCTKLNPRLLRALQLCLWNRCQSTQLWKCAWELWVCCAEEAWGAVWRAGKRPRCLFILAPPQASVARSCRRAGAELWERGDAVLCTEAAGCAYTDTTCSSITLSLSKQSQTSHWQTHSAQWQNSLVFRAADWAQSDDWAK